MIFSLARWLYSVVTNRYHEAYNRGEKTIIRVPAKVISIGNISTGGTGKSPMTRFIATGCMRAGISCAIISRGYGRKSKGLVVVSDGERLLVDVEQAGDEPFMNAEELIRQGCRVPVIVHSDKVRAAQYAVEQFLTQCIIVDDGFQHRRLYRDTDIVLVDRLTLNNPTLLPVGRLREPLSALARADIVIGMNGVKCEEFARYAPKVHCATAEVVPGEMVTLVGEYDKTQPLLAIAGIAHPDRFLQTLVHAGCEIRANRWFHDHHRFREHDIEVIIQMAKQYGCRGVICTEKDAVKVRRFTKIFTNWGMSLSYLPISIRVFGLSFSEDFYMQTNKQI